MKKITKKELETLKSLQSNKSDIYYNIAKLEVQKHSLLHKSNLIDQDLSDALKNIKDKYGDVKIDPETGAIHGN
jgi:hypothetical protein